MTNPGTVIPLLEQLISYTPFLQPHVLTENNYELTYTSDFYYWRPQPDYSRSGLPVMGYMFGAIGGLAAGALQAASGNQNQWLLQKINYRKGNSVPVSWVPNKPK